MTKTYVVSAMTFQVEAYSPEHAAELAQREIQAGNFAIYDVNEGQDNFEIDLNSLEYLKKKLKEVSDNIYCLECSDDYLMTNANGNLDRFNNLKAEASELSKRIAEHPDNA